MSPWGPWSIKVIGPSAWESTALVVIARLLAAQGQLDAALQTVDEATGGYESQRTRVDAFDLRASASPGPGRRMRCASTS